MSILIVVLIVLTGLGAIQTARRRGIWSNKRFFGAVLAAVTIGLLATAPIYFISPATLQEHQGLAIAGILTVIFAGVIAITIYAKRWTKRGP